MSKKGYIVCKDKQVEKCEICIQSKMTKKPFPSVERNNQLLELIHSDICELNGELTRRGKKIFYHFYR